MSDIDSKITILNFLDFNGSLAFWWSGKLHDLKHSISAHDPFQDIDYDGALQLRVTN